MRFIGRLVLSGASSAAAAATSRLRFQKLQKERGSFRCFISTGFQWYKRTTIVEPFLNKLFMHALKWRVSAFAAKAVQLFYCLACTHMQHRYVDMTVANVTL